MLESYQVIIKNSILNNFYLACRSKERAKAAIEDIKSKSGNQNVEFMTLDLSNLDSVREVS